MRVFVKDLKEMLKMRTCNNRPDCGVASHNIEAKFCWNCGEKLVEAPAFCEHCKASINPADRFCPSCGRPLK